MDWYAYPFACNSLSACAAGWPITLGTTPDLVMVVGLTPVVVVADWAAIVFAGAVVAGGAVVALEGLGLCFVIATTPMTTPTTITNTPTMMRLRRLTTYQCAIGFLEVKAVPCHWRWALAVFPIW